MTVKELIEFLSTQPQHLPVLYKCCSEYCLLESKDIVVDHHCHPRPDGWVANCRPDKETMEYLVFPGN
jgi:hypothetical protein